MHPRPDIPYTELLPKQLALWLNNPAEALHDFLATRWQKIKLYTPHLFNFNNNNSACATTQFLLITLELCILLCKKKCTFRSTALETVNETTKCDYYILTLALDGYRLV